MKKIIEFCKNRYKMLIPIMVVVVLLVTILFLYKEYKYVNGRNKEEVSVYQYFGGIRYDYTAIVSYNLKKSIVGIAVKDKKIDYTSVPIYYKDSDKVIFPKSMNIAFPLKEGIQYKLYQYASYYYEDGLHYIKNNEDTSSYEYFFMYDGKNLFFFPTEVTLYIDDKEYTKLGNMSYVYIMGDTLKYYDYLTDTSEVIELGNENVYVSSKYINVDIKKRSFKSFNNNIILQKPDNLNPVFKVIDK